MVTDSELQGKFVAGYIGTHGPAHALDTLLDAAKDLKAAPDGDRFRIVLLGDGANKAALRQHGETQGTGQRHFCGFSVQGSSSSLLIATGCIHHPPQKGGTFDKSHPVQVI